MGNTQDFINAANLNMLCIHITEANIINHRTTQPCNNFSMQHNLTALSPLSLTWHTYTHAWTRALGCREQRLEIEILTVETMDDRGLGPTSSCYPRKRETTSCFNPDSPERCWIKFVQRGSVSDHKQKIASCTRDKCVLLCVVFPVFCPVVCPVVSRL